MPGTHVDLDGAAADAARRLGLPTIDARTWGPRLRFCAPPTEIERFHRELAPRLDPFVLLGSGDFHHLAALWTLSTTSPANPASPEPPVALVSFDNHPDWDRRPPRFACGAWICRVLERPTVASVTVWGCGNFELALPGRLFGSRDPRLTIRPWFERLAPADRTHYAAVDRATWRSAFETFAASLAPLRVYITIDLDCLAPGEASTNWEPGLFTVDDLRWAVSRLKTVSHVVGGDLCGAYSTPTYARWRQRIAGNWDHPNVPPPDAASQERTTLAMVAIWNALTA